MEDSTFPEMDLEAISILGSVMKQTFIYFFIYLLLSLELTK